MESLGAQGKGLYVISGVINGSNRRFGEAQMADSSSM